MEFTREDLRVAAEKQEVAAKANQFTAEAQVAWAETDITKKKELIITTMIERFKYTRKIETFKRNVIAARNTARLDSLIANLLHYGEGNAVIRR